ncbi:Oil body-associated protein 2C [Balamuthia mandrillaris]
MQAGAPQEVTRTPTSEVVPGEDKAMKTKLFELGSKAMQSLGPVNSINMHLCGLAFYVDNPERQVELHHYCTNLNDEVTQCVVYDSDKPDARLVGVEYVISHRLFNNLDPEEQKLWHSHQTDVKTASFIAPELPERIDRALMSKLANTYGKTWVLWQTDKGDPLPLGGPQLMMVKTKTEDWNPQLFAHRGK